jgi:EAL domain-containing protein (putative c-di-GMP-specific phosphodiesterase class I)
LIRFPIDVVKIDRAFVSGIGKPEVGLLGNEACDLLQGYWLCRPIPPDELAGVLSRQQA